MQLAAPAFGPLALAFVRVAAAARCLLSVWPLRDVSGRCVTLPMSIDGSVILAGTALGLDMLARCTS